MSEANDISIHFEWKDFDQFTFSPITSQTYGGKYKGGYICGFCRYAFDKNLSPGSKSEALEEEARRARLKEHAIRECPQYRKILEDRKKSAEQSNKDGRGESSR